MRNHLFSFAVIALAMTACSSEEPLPAAPSATEQKTENPFRVSVKEALDAAAKTREEFFGTSTRAASAPDVRVVYANPGTRSGDNAMYYVINYGNDGGFAVVSADRRMEAIQAISDEGRLSMEDTVENKGLALFFSQLNGRYASAAIGTQPVIPVDTTMHEIVIPIDKTVKTGPLLAKSVRKWYQGYPCNSFCPQINSTPCKVGCLALATAQILSYNQFPVQLGDRDVDWEIINTVTYNPHSYYLLAELGSLSYFGLDYGLYETYGLEEKIVPVFKKLGYGIASRLSYQDYAVSHLSKGPALVCSSEVGTNKNHAWVIDGSLVHKYQQPDYVTGEWIWKSDHYVHCVWGHGSIGDGYYRWQSEIGGTSSSLDKDDESGSFPKQTSLRIYSDFQRN